MIKTNYSTPIKENIGTLPWKSATEQDLAWLIPEDDSTFNLRLVGKIESIAGTHILPTVLAPKCQQEMSNELGDYHNTQKWQMFVVSSIEILVITDFLSGAPSLRSRTGRPKPVAVKVYNWID